MNKDLIFGQPATTKAVPNLDSNSGDVTPTLKKNFIMYTSQKQFHETSLQQFNTLTNRKDTTLLIEKYVKNKPSLPEPSLFGPSQLLMPAPPENMLARRLNQQSNADGINVPFGIEIKHEPRSTKQSDSV